MVDFCLHICYHNYMSSKKQQLLHMLETSVRPLSVGEVADLAEVSRVYASRVLNELMSEGVLKSEKVGARRYFRHIDGVVFLNKTFDAYGLHEDEVLSVVRRDRRFLEQVGESAQSAFEFAFPEMLNNAIEHSLSKKIHVMARLMRGQLEFVVRDFGIGVFRNICAEKHLDTERDALNDLLKGKNTTAPHAHSGMGIFFTSKLADVFCLRSYALGLIIDNNLRDIFVDEVIPELTGTEVNFVIDAQSKRSVSEVFRSFSIDPDDGDFDRTKVPVKLYRMGSIYVSRSQARALLSGLNKFKEVTLDFSGVENVGQAFADEIFRVYAIGHPEVKIDYVNANDNVKFMISLAKNGLKGMGQD